MKPDGFTLVELLVVITVIVVLLGMLAPAMEKAVYQAELTVCGAQIRGVVSAVTAYAMENVKLYPHRPTTGDSPGTAEQGWYVYNIVHPDPAMGMGRDDRPYLRGHMSLELLVDPLGGKLDLDSPPGDKGNWVMSNYPLWWGIRYPAPNGGKWIRKIGDRLEWIDRSRNPEVRELRSSILVSDLDGVYTEATEFSSSHPEPDTKHMWFIKAQEVAQLNTAQTFSWWFSRNASSVERNPIDLNYGYADNSVRRINGVQSHDGRMARVGLFNKLDLGPYENTVSTFWHQLPLD